MDDPTEHSWICEKQSNGGENAKQELRAPQGDGGGGVADCRPQPQAGVAHITVLAKPCLSARPPPADVTALLALVNSRLHCFSCDREPIPSTGQAADQERALVSS